MRSLVEWLGLVLLQLRLEICFSLQSASVKRLGHHRYSSDAHVARLQISVLVKPGGKPMLKHFLNLHCMPLGKNLFLGLEFAETELFRCDCKLAPDRRRLDLRQISARCVHSRNI